MIAIVDDRLDDQAELEAMLVQYCTQNRLSMDYQIFSSAEELLADVHPDQFQIAFLDIYMCGMDGMQAARQLSRTDPHCRMIFSTTSHSHAVESYEVRAAYYLTKPLDYARLCSAMSAACAELLHDNRCVALHCAGVPCELLLRDVLFVDCAAEHTRLHLMHRMILPDERVSEVFAMLSQDPRFLNCNRNVTVNMDQISKTQENTFLLKNGESVPIRQRDCGAVKRAFLQYSLRSLRKNGGI